MGLKEGQPNKPKPRSRVLSSLSRPVLPIFRYQHRDKPDHAHPTKDWIGLFLLDAPPSTTTSTSHQEPPKSSRDAQGNPNDRRFQHRPAHIQYPSGTRTAANDDHGENEKDMRAVAASAADPEGSAGESTEAGPIAEKLRTSVVGVTKNLEGGEDADALDAHEHELGGGRSKDNRYFRRSQVAATFVGGIPIKPTATGGAGISAEENARREKKGQLPGKMVGWRTLPRENEVRASGTGGVRILTA